jgi:hypothetical protein
MKGYAQDLDTVNFSSEKNVGGKLEGMLIDAKVKTILYSAFYTISLSPNQVIDLLLVREKFYDTQAFSSLPFSFHLDSGIYRAENPFEKQLLLFLRREGNNAFVFSSIPNGIEKANEWGEFVKENSRISDADLIKEANDDLFYREIVEWVKKLDSDISKINIEPFNKSSYENLFLDYIEASQNRDFISYPVPKSRSQAYQLISDDHKQDIDIRKRKQLPDLISNIQYAIGTKSKLILEYSSPCVFDVKKDYIKYMPANVSIDIKSLLKKYPDVETAIIDSDLKKISIALNKSREEVDTAWKVINDKKLALKYFSKGLKIFLSNIVGKDIIEENPIDLGYVLPKTPDSLGELKIHLNFLKRLRLRKKKFKGIDKFINIK